MKTNFCETNVKEGAKRTNDLLSFLIGNILCFNLNFWPIVKNATSIKLLYTLLSVIMGRNSEECKRKSSAKIINLFDGVSWHLSQSQQ
jgi:hypothetical protein